MGAAAKKAAAVLRTAGENKRTALNAAAAALRARQAEILAANKEDLKAAKENGMSEAMLDRLALTPARIEGKGRRRRIRPTRPRGPHFKRRNEPQRA